jgi:RHS repeat-associated protein
LTTCSRADGRAGFNYPFLTSKERDIETGLDYFVNRYYSSTQARFTSADEPFADQVENDPQSWNLYIYGSNNPLRYRDLTGEAHWEVGADGQQHYVGDKIGEYDKDLNADWDGTNWNSRENNGADSTVVGQPLTQIERMALGDFEFGITAAGGLRVVNSARSASLFSRAGSFLKRLFGGGQGAEFAGGVTRTAIQAAAADPGPTVRVVTRLTQAPGAGRGLSAATGEGAEALANATRDGGQVYTARIPKALIETLKSARLVEERVTQMNGARAVELRFRPEAAEFINRFFH